MPELISIFLNYYIVLHQPTPSGIFCEVATMVVGCGCVSSILNFFISGSDYCGCVGQFILSSFSYFGSCHYYFAVVMIAPFPVLVTHMC